MGSFGAIAARFYAMPVASSSDALVMKVPRFLEMKGTSLPLCDHDRMNQMMFDLGSVVFFQALAFYFHPVAPQHCSSRKLLTTQSLEECQQYPTFSFGAPAVVRLGKKVLA